MENKSNKSIVLFIPEVGIYPFMRGLAVLGDAVKKEGGEVFVTHCSGQMVRCPMMVMHDVPAEDLGRKAELCKMCDRSFQCAQRKYQFSPIELSDLVNDALVNDIEKHISKNSNDPENIQYKGFPAGKFSQYDFILETKFPYYKGLSQSHRIIYLSYIKNAALALALADGICERYKPDLLMTFNEYAQYQAVRHSANTHGVSRMAVTYPVHFNIDASRFPIWGSTCEYWRYKHCQNWNKMKDVPVVTRDVAACWDDGIFRMYSSGTHIFSSRKKSNPALISKKLRLDPNKKTIVVYPSSQDERGSVEIAMKIWDEDNHIADAFPNQIEWLSMLKDYAAKRNDVQIVARIHPREGSRGRGFDSQHLMDLKEKFPINTPSFIIVWPDDPISSYDLMELADVCLVTWSLMGQEAARLGIPVLSCTGNMFYPDDDFIQVATTPEEYRRKLDSILKMEFTWQHLLKAVRFYHWRIFVTSLDLGETVPADVQDDTIWPDAPPSMVGVINDILFGRQDLIEYNIKKWQDSLPADALKQESEAMRLGIRCFLDKIFYPPISYEQTFGIVYRVYRKARKILGHLIGKKASLAKKTKYPFADYRLEFVADISRLEELRQRTKQDKDLRVLVADGLDAILVHNGKLTRRMSPMVIRLARLYASSIK